ncbi:MAG: type 11 methyltransferase [uncultured bacterium]|nr:MAG: type 11 methyltransferase [uncultured bacterium]
MDRTEQEKNTRAYYDQHAGEFKKFRGEEISLYWEEELKRLQELLPEGTVLEVGCGIGNEAYLLKEMGYDYLGIDNSRSMLKEAKSICPEGNFVCQDFRSIGISSEFDGLVAFAALLHLEKEEMTATLVTLRNQLRPGGIGLFTLKKGSGTEIDAKGRFYSYYSSEELAGYFLDAGFTVLEHKIKEAKGQTYVCLFVQNP